MADILDLIESQKNVSKASKIYFDALAEEKRAVLCLAVKKQQIKLDNMEALVSKEMTAAVHGIKVEAETYEEEIKKIASIYDRKMCNTQLESLKIKHHVLKTQFNLM